jgi:hypothetical protein
VILRVLGIETKKKKKKKIDEGRYGALITTKIIKKQLKIVGYVTCEEEKVEKEGSKQTVDRKSIGIR